MNYRDKRGGWRTRTLFIDNLSPAEVGKFDTPYTLKEYDIEKNGKTYKSLYKLFMSCADEFEFYNTYLGGSGHWAKLESSAWFGQGKRRGCHKGTEKWKEDMRARDESLAKKLLLKAVEDGDVSAAKKLFDVSKKPANTKRGTFIKEEAKKEAVKKAEDQAFLEDTALRLNVVKIRE